jgi:FkbM family methyltransferase
MQPTLNVRVATILTKPSFGNFIARLFRDQIPVGDFTIDTSSERISDSAKAALFWRLYERRERMCIRKYLDPNLDVVELGGSIGVAACQIRRKLSPQRKLVTVEANPKLIDILNTNLKINNCLENTKILNRAIAYHQETVLFYAPPHDHAGAHLAHPEQIEQHPDETISVAAITLSKILETEQIEEFTLVSDVEGAEAEILRYEGNSLKRCRQIIIELHDTTLDSQVVTIDQMVKQLEEEYTPLYLQGRIGVFQRKGTSPKS